MCNAIAKATGVVNVRAALRGFRRAFWNLRPNFWNQRIATEPSLLRVRQLGLVFLDCQLFQLRQLSSPVVDAVV